MRRASNIGGALTLVSAAVGLLLAVPLATTSQASTIGTSPIGAPAGGTDVDVCLDRTATPEELQQCLDRQGEREASRDDVSRCFGLTGSAQYNCFLYYL